MGSVEKIYVCLCISKCKLSEEMNEWIKSTNYEEHKCDFLFMVLPGYEKTNFTIDESWFPSDMRGKVVLVDGKGMLSHFWWVDTVEALDM